MKLIALVMLVAVLCVPAMFAQDEELNHGTIGAFMNYFRLEHADANMIGIGGRLGVNVHPNLQLEGEAAYDFERNFDTTIPLPGGAPNTFARSPLRLVHGLFGPKLQVGTGAFRAFVLAKGGFLNFSRNKNFAGAIGAVPNGDTNGVFYPGGGFEAYAGAIGIRVEAGDEMYWDNGANHNLRVTVGPQFRF
ncbi:MAG TPA: hypothetical protein VN622_11135 [Clostridia bacterium]|nr:hypothetical protein [Clostridia bacterium]